MRAFLAFLLLTTAVRAEAFRAIDETYTFEVTTISQLTGEPTDADSAPTYRVYEDETATPILTGSMALLDAANTDGWYSEQITCSAANGFEAGKSYRIRIAATVGGANGATERELTVSSQLAATTLKTSFLPSVTAGASGGLFIAGANAATTVNFTGNLSGSVGSVTGNVGGNVLGSTGSISGVTFPINFSTLTVPNIQNGLANAFDVANVGTDVVAVYDRIGAPAGATLAADVATRASQTAVDAVPTAVWPKTTSVVTTISSTSTPERRRPPCGCWSKRPSTSRSPRTRRSSKFPRRG